MRFLLTLAVAAWSLVAATAQTSYFPNINVRTNATVRDLTVTSTNWSLPMPSTGLLGGTAGGAAGVKTNLVVSSNTSVETNAAVTITRSFSGTALEYPITMLLRNPGDASGGSDYQNQVHIRFHAGTTNDHREYLSFANYEGVDKWITGRNSLNSWILYDVGSVAHRIYMNTSTNNGKTYLNSTGTGGVEINNTREAGADVFGTGGFEVFNGGSYPSSTVFKVSPNDANSVLSASTAGVGYAPASLRLTATQADYRGGGIFYHNDVSKSSWFYGVPYTNGTARWSINFSSNSVWSSTLAQARYSLLTVLSNGNVGIRLGEGAPNSTLQVAGSVSHSVATGSAFTLTATNEVYLVNVDAQTVTLPTAVGVNGRTYTVKAITPCTTATIATTSSQLIDGAASYSLSASNKFVRVISDNANWWVIGNN